MFGRSLESLSRRRKSKIIKWSMLTNYGWQIISCLSVSPTLLSFPDRVGPNSRWCRREAWTWDIQISGSLTSTPGKQGGAINARFICKCIFFLSPNSLYCLEIYVFYVFCLKKTENSTSHVEVALCTWSFIVNFNVNGAFSCRVNALTQVM